MKNTNHSSLFTGLILILLTALFSVSLIIQASDLSILGLRNIAFINTLGKILFNVYGFSSFLIPVFLLTASSACFGKNWNPRKSLRLITAVVPFFTCVITENIVKSILALRYGNFNTIKIAVAIITGVMLLIIEYLGTGILADKFSKSDSESKDSVPEPEFSEEIPAKDNTQIFTDVLDEVKPEQVYFYDSDDETIPPVELDEEIQNSETHNEQKITFKEDQDETLISEPENTEKAETKEDETSETTENTNLLTKEETNKLLGTEDLDTNQENSSSQEKIEEETPNRTNILTQEEYAALTIQPEDELEWPNLPPVQEELPPDYQDDFEDDPDLDFPPREEPEEIEDDFEENSEEITGEKPNFQDEITDQAFDIEFGTENSDSQEINTSDSEEVQENLEEKKTELDEAYQENEITEEIPFSNKIEDAYSAAKFIDAVVEKSIYPKKITLRDESYYQQKALEEKAKMEKQVPPKKYDFPSKINLNDEISDQILEFESLNNQVEDETSQEDDYTDDPTLPFPNFQDFEFDEENSNNFNPSFAEENSDENSISSDFYDVDVNHPDFLDDDDMNEDEAEDVLADEIFNNSGNADFNINNENIFNQIAQNEMNQSESENPTIGFSYASTDVFSQMENDIRKENPRPVETEQHIGHKPIQAIAPDELNQEEFEEDNFQQDEDFFEIQNKLNTPVTEEIPAKPEKTNRANKKGPYTIPSDLLTAYKDDQYWVIDEETKDASLRLKQTLAEFNIEAEVIGIKKGPVVTMFELLPAPGVRLSKIVALQDNIALSLAAQSVRIVAPIPGKQAVGIEVPNTHRSIVGFREIIEMKAPEWNNMAVPVILGKDILGKAQIIDLVKTPHMLIAGATGSGKSVCVNSLILSILYKRSFNDVKLILVDPKVVELKLYNNIPHLLTPVITEPKKALQALQYCLCEMERRYALLDSVGVRDISTYNKKIKDRGIMQEKLPYIVVIIDEFADLMATSGRELESIVARLTAMSRAVGIHLVLATQRPSVNVITGLIKANIPSRIAFMVSSRTDSNIILDAVGAEKLLGRGDMLYGSAVDPAPIRIQGTFVSDQEVEDVVNAVKEYGEPDYLDDEIFVDDDDDISGATDLFGQPIDDDDPLYDQALDIVVQAGKASASYIQRRLKIGYNRAARLVEQMEERGIVGPANGSKPREVIYVP